MESGSGQRLDFLHHFLPVHTGEKILFLFVTGLDGDMVNCAVGFGLGVEGGEGSRVLTEEMGGKAGFFSVLPHFAWFAAEGVGFLTFFQEKV